jgi:hypothetical protein
MLMRQICQDLSTWWATQVKLLKIRVQRPLPILTAMHFLLALMTQMAYTVTIDEPIVVIFGG